jgi:hypothetical protein
MNPDTQDKSFFTMNVLGALIVGLILGFVIGAVYTKNAVKTTNDNLMGTTTPLVIEGQNGTSTTAGDAGNNDTSNTSGNAGRNQASVSDQKAGNSVVVSNLTLDKSYWVAVRDSVQQGKISYILGARRLQAGSYNDLRINLISRSTEPGKSYDIVLYGDTGGAFNYDPSNVVLVSGTNFALATFKAQ